MKMDTESNNKDLPLMANVNDILVNHYLFNLFCSFEEHSFYGYVVMELKPLTKSCYRCSPESILAESNECRITSDCDTKTLNQSDFIAVLDCNDIIVDSVEEIVMTVSSFHNYKFTGTMLNFSETVQLNFAVEKWSLKISKPGVLCPCKFPTVIKISYRTKPEGQSLLWVTDQDKRPAVYTYGAWINNRSLYPCQEPPVAMATWEAYISVVNPGIVLMSGDNKPIISSSKGVTYYYFSTKMKLPLSTLALAVGFWKVDEIECSKIENVVCRISASPSILSKAVKEFSNYIPSCLEAAESLLGSYPFSRIDFLIVPRGFCSLGMASPNIIFLSQSLLSDKQTMCCRVAHEVSHAWFGLLIGALDWTEEWLSEGFATFMEDLVHTKALCMEASKEKQYWEFKAHMRFKTLMSEIGNTDEELQVLRPNKGETVKENVDGVEAVILKNGRNSEKAFMQVHYIKGYFLLKYLCDLVGLCAFLKFLNIYISKYKGQLVESTEMLDFFAQTFPEISEHNVTVDNIVSDWLHTTGMPKELLNCQFLFMSGIFKTASEEAKKWKMLNKKCMKKSHKRTKYDYSSFSMLSSEKLLILLDELLEEGKISNYILKNLVQFYNLENQDAEIRHKWCELIIKHRYRPGYACLKNFLLNDLAMGIYLYGELILNGTPLQKNIAEESFKVIQSEMEPNCIETIKQMLETATSALPSKNISICS